MISETLKREEIPAAIAAYLTQKDVSRAELARISGVNETTLSYMAKGSLVIPNQTGGSKIKERSYRDICGVIGFALDKDKAWKHFNTANFVDIVSQVKRVRAERTRGTVDGDTGAGKSYSLRMYQKRFPTGTYLVKCYADENSKEFARNIGETVGVETFGTAGNIIKKVCQKLNSMEDAILIIDEAEHIKNKSGYINIVKSLADRLEGRVAFLLSGMDINDILQRASDKHKQNFRQTARRFSRRMNCNPDIAPDIEKIGHELGFSEPSISWLQNRIHNFGELEIIVTDALNESKVSRQPVSQKLLNVVFQ